MTHSTISGSVQSIHNSVERQNYKYVLRVDNTEITLTSSEVLATNPGDLITATGYYKGPRFEASSIRNETTGVIVSVASRGAGCILTIFAGFAGLFIVLALTHEAPFFFLLALVPGGLAAFGFINANNHQKAIQALETTPTDSPPSDDH